MYLEKAGERALEYANVLGNKHIHAMSGLVPPGGDTNRHRQTLIENLKRVVPAAERPEKF